MKAATLLSLSLLLVPAVAGAAAKPPNPYLDLDFETAECGSGWALGGSTLYEYGFDPSTAHSGHQSLRIRYIGSQPWTANAQDFGLSDQIFPPALAAGKHLRITAWIRTDGVDDGGRDGGAGLWLEATRNRDEILTSVTSSDMVTGTTGWAQHSLDVDVPAGAAEIEFGATFGGSGTAWFDGFTLQVDGKKFVDGPRPSTAKPAPAAVSWLRKQAIPFTTAEAGNGFDDLQKLKKVVGDARIVALGEATHGTHEFFQMKHRLVEFLANEMGFTLFAIEANQPEATRVNDYVLNGRGDPREALKGLYFWTWNTQEVLDMIEWMRAFNQSGRGRIQFMGFDMQYADVAAANVRSFLATVEPGFAAQAGQDLAAAQKVANAEVNGLPSPIPADQGEAAARNVFEHMTAQRGAYLSRLPQVDVDWAIQNARVVLQSVEAVTGTVSRDQSMADNVGWILDQAPPDSKIVLWAHNAHVGKRPTWMGSYLSQRFGRDLAVLGFAFGQGEYNALGDGSLGPRPAVPSLPGSVEAFLGSPGIPRFIVDLRGIPSSSPAAAWVGKSRLFRSIGAVASRCGFNPTVISSDYDGLIWFSQTSPSILLPF
ncbi:MAG TPA: erythromycin esterase family protein [Thermoanaerobaculia bacterium]|jgi:erythromycin esterase|nr:erythromycin esterase family protein [Thermoanaerobaculia bacterium]